MKDVLEKLDKSIGDLGTRFGGKLESIEKAGQGLETRLASLEERFRTRQIEVPGLRDHDKDGSKFSFARACLGLSTGDWDRWGAGYERDVMREATRSAEKQGRVLSSSVDGSGGYLVPAQYTEELIELLRADAVVLALGARELSGLIGSPVPLSKQTGGATGYWVAEGNSISASDQSFGEINLRPHSAAALTKLSNRLLAQTANQGIKSAERIVREDLAKTLALLIDVAALTGTGAGEQPIGIANATGVGTLSLNANPTIDHLIDMVKTVANANALRGSLGFVMHPRTWFKLLKLKDGEGKHYLVPDASRPWMGTLLGYRAAQTTQLSIILGSTTDESELIFGNFAEIFVATWGGLELEASRETSDAFEKRQTWIRIVQEVDIAVRHGASFVYTNDVRDD